MFGFRSVFVVKIFFYLYFLLGIGNLWVLVIIDLRKDN